MLGKLSAAQTKLAQGKFADAVQKLTEYSTQVQTLAATGKLDPTQATALYDEAQAAIACIQTLG